MTHSEASQSLSTVAATELGAAPPDALLPVIQTLLREQAIGLLWLDRRLEIVERQGGLVEQIPLGVAVGNGVLALLGSEQEIAALARDPGRWLMLPNLLVAFAGEPPRRLDFGVRWIEERAMFLVAIGQTVPRALEEEELQRQARLRSMAEQDLRRANLSLEQANLELSRANGELDRFAHVLSHDLEAPLRALRLLVRDLSGAATSGADGARIGDFCDRISRQSARMSEMLRGMHDLARAGRTARTVREVDTGQLMRDIAASLPKPERFDVAMRGAWPHAWLVPAAFDQVMRNLVQNAIQHHDRDSGSVIMEARSEAGWLEVAVRDDGPGIPAEWREAVFEPFVRRNPSDAEGSAGIGLALVRRVAERCGASVTLASGGGRGATFIVRWPIEATGADEWLD